MQKTFKELLELDAVIGGLYQKNPALRETKFGWAQKRFYETNIAPTLKEYRDKTTEIQINNALEDKTTKALLIDPKNPRGYLYSREGQIKCIAEENKLWEEYQAMEVEVKPYISTYVPDLTEEQTELLKGLLI